MSRPVIEVSAVSKHYVIQHESRHDNLRDTLHHTARKLWRRVRWGTGFETEEFWALRDISFSVQPGEVVGIIGRNGAGKSTLLKILSRITEPTSGRIALRGRVASLLEVGTGFHPDLTGRENIFLNGAILGMQRKEITRKFDEIVAFAEVERFLDTPVKRYSSGMYVRLAFAVAAHLEPEILIVDEVLAVGDAQFQKKCLSKMQNVAANEGRTILFVSHNLAAVKQLTSRCIYLVRGELAAAGPTGQILDRYAQAGEAAVTGNRGKFTTVVESSLVDAQGLRTANYHTGASLFLEVLLDSTGNPQSSLECYLTDLAGTKLGLYSPGHFTGWRLPPTPGRHRLRLPLRLPPLASGTYGLDIATTVHGRGHDHYVAGAVTFETSSLLNFPAKWELRKEYAAGYFILDGGDPVSFTPEGGAMPGPGNRPA
jgi:lipopolysaccharide transport system ATP-binding protein